MGMKRVAAVTVVLVASLWVSSAAAQDGVDAQIRLAFHKQPAVSGWSPVVWLVLPDMTATDKEGENTGLTSLSLVGAGWGSKPNWVEFLIGARVNQAGLFRLDPTFNLRGSRKIGKLNFYGEAHLYPRGQSARAFSFVSADAPMASSSPDLEAAGIILRLGLESEVVSRFHGQDSGGAGPRASLVLRLPPHIGARKIALTVAHQFRNDQNFLRWYVVFLR